MKSEGSVCIIFISWAELLASDDECVALWRLNIIQGSNVNDQWFSSLEKLYPSGHLEVDTKKVNAISEMLPGAWLFEALFDNDPNACIIEMQDKWWDKNRGAGITKHIYETDPCLVSIVYRN